MGWLILSISLIVALVVGPIFVARVFPSRTGMQGNVVAGESGVSASFWGYSFGLVAWLFVLALLIILDPIVGPLSVRLQLGGLVFVTLGLLVVPLILCGFHRWRWGPEGLQFIGALRREKIAWADICEVRQTLDRGQLFRTARGACVRTSEYTVGVRLIAAAFAHYRPNFGESA